MTTQETRAHKPSQIGIHYHIEQTSFANQAMVSTPRPEVASSVLMGPPPPPAPPRQIIYNRLFALSNPLPLLPQSDDHQDNHRKTFLSPRMSSTSRMIYRLNEISNVSSLGQDGYVASQLMGGDLASDDNQQETAIQKRRASRRLKQKSCLTSNLSSSLKSSATSATTTTANSSFTSASASLSSSQKSINGGTNEMLLDGASMSKILAGFDSDEEEDSSVNSIVNELLKYEFDD